MFVRRDGRRSSRIIISHCSTNGSHKRWQKKCESKSLSNKFHRKLKTLESNKEKQQKKSYSSFLLNKKSSITTKTSLHRCAKRCNLVWNRFCISLLPTTHKTPRKKFNFPFRHASGVCVCVCISGYKAIYVCGSFNTLRSKTVIKIIFKLQFVSTNEYNTDVNNSSATRAFKSGVSPQTVYSNALFSFCARLQAMARFSSFVLQFGAVCGRSENCY